MNNLLSRKNLTLLYALGEFASGIIPARRAVPQGRLPHIQCSRAYGTASGQGCPRSQEQRVYLVLETQPRRQLESARPA